MNRDRRSKPKRRQFPLRVPRGVALPAEHAPDDVAPWLIAEVRTWPRSAEDRLVATCIGVSLQQVRRARAA